MRFSTAHTQGNQSEEIANKTKRMKETEGGREREREQVTTKLFSDFQRFNILLYYFVSDLIYVFY